MAYIYDIADTWNASGTTFKGIALNVTDTASAAGSLLMDLQVGGVSRFQVRKDGRLFGNSYYFDSLNGVILGGSNQVMVALEGAGAFHSFKTGHFMMSSIVKLGWSSDAPLSTTGLSALDLTLFRDAANTLAQRNGVNAQAFNLYNTYTDASNYERGFMRFVSNVLQIGAEAAGTGTGRNVSISPGGTGTQIVSIATVGFQVFDLRYNATPFVQFQKYAGGGTTGWVSNASDIHYRWTSSGTAAVEGDVGIKRDAAGVLKITNGNNAASGTGKLIFIVPTTDPGITGALWNNAGTLAISA